MTFQCEGTTIDGSRCKVTVYHHSKEKHNIERSNNTKHKLHINCDKTKKLCGQHCDCNYCGVMLKRAQQGKMYSLETSSHLDEVQPLIENRIDRMVEHDIIYNKKSSYVHSITNATEIEQLKFLVRSFQMLYPHLYNEIKTKARQMYNETKTNEEIRTLETRLRFLKLQEGRI